MPAQKPLIKSVQSFLQSANGQQYQQEQQLLVFALCHISKPICQFFEFQFTDLVQHYQIQTPEVNLHSFHD